MSFMNPRFFSRAAVSRITIPKTCRSFAARNDKRDFVVRNDRNDVIVDRCAKNEAFSAYQLLPPLPHIAVAGVTNAGKSSLINHILRKNHARSSSVSGKTVSVDFMRVNERFVLADTPGIPAPDGQLVKEWSRIYFPLMQLYLQNFQVSMLLFAHDVRVTATEDEVDFLRWARDQLEIPILLVLTKDDHVLNHKTRVRWANRVRNELGHTGPHVHYRVDTEDPASRRGRRSLLRFIDTVVTSIEKSPEPTRDDIRAIFDSVWVNKEGNGLRAPTNRRQAMVRTPNTWS